MRRSKDDVLGLLVGLCGLRFSRCQHLARRCHLGLCRRQLSCALLDHRFPFLAARVAHTLQGRGSLEYAGAVRVVVERHLVRAAAVAENVAAPAAVMPAHEEGEGLGAELARLPVCVLRPVDFWPLSQERLVCLGYLESRHGAGAVAVLVLVRTGCWACCFGVLGSARSAGWGHVGWLLWQHQGGVGLRSDLSYTVTQQVYKQHICVVRVYRVDLGVAMEGCNAVG